MKIIGVKGQWVLSLSEPLDNLEYFDISSFKMISEAGNIMPSCEIVFTLRNKEKFHELNQGKVITIGVGNNENNLAVGNFTIFSRKKLKEENNNVNVRLLLTHQAINYSIDTKVDIKHEKSLPLLSNIATRNSFIFQTNIEDTVDKMKWVQSNISDRSMVNKLWFHSILPNQTDLMLVGITPDNKFLCRSFEKTKDGIGVGKWAFIPDSTSPTNGFTPIIYTQNPEYRSNTGTIDYLNGYSKSRIVHSDNNNSNYVTARQAPTLAQTSKDESINPTQRIGAISYQSKDNMHSDYYARQEYTIRCLTKFNAHTVKIATETFFPGCVTDIAFLYDKHKAEDTQGKYLIKKVCHRISNNRYVALITLCRDNPNEVKD